MDPAAPETTPDATAPDSVSTAPRPADRWLLLGFGLWAALLLVAAFAQLTDNRTLLELFDLRDLFM